ncbi:4715_t:CDS:2, partial [Dentiscutata heterogama]
MPLEQNKGPCKVKDCNHNANRYYKFTAKAIEKSKKKNTFDDYNYLILNNQLYDAHYLRIVEPDRGNKKKLTDFVASKKIYEKDIIIDISDDQVTLNKNDFIKLINRTNELKLLQAKS